ncbi:MAG: diaminopimelate epimerase [Xanthomonadales bacterium]|nr:diaminopimelate epimerase [Xanthomonadales bacterium]
MPLHFYKMNGAGNDFIVIDNRSLSINLSAGQIEALCDRHRGIGADGLLAVEPATQGADYKFRYYNADGGEGEMCGNGARCFGKFTARLGANVAKVVSFETIAGVLSAEMVGDKVRIAMSDPFDLEMNTDVKIDSLATDLHVLNTGVPHAVAFVEDLESLDVVKIGAAIRNHDRFSPHGTNANFARVISKNHIEIRTYERGVEDETLACGTGTCAAAIIHRILTGASSPVKVNVAGGDTLEVGFEETAKNQFTNVTLSGPADWVFEGDVEI